jgi:predicted AlkP superfamily pyrophosphatase or phosphodiesterase
VPTPVTFAGLALAVGLALGFPAAGTGPASPAPSGAGHRVAAARHVVAISVDGLNPEALRDLGRRRTPVLHRLRAHGAGTLNARTEREMTVTLPNHVGMVTGRRVAARHGGHGVTWNDARLRPRTVERAAGHRVRSVFSVVHSHGGDTAVFASKEKFTLFERSWPRPVDRSVVQPDNTRLVRTARRDLTRSGRTFTFVHLSLPDIVGHEHGFMSRRYLRAVARVDELVGRLVSAVRHDRGLRGRTTVVLTADHGGLGSGHSDPTLRSSYRVPFLVWGAGVVRGAGLYALNRDYADPGRHRTRYGARRQPVRNGDVANLALDLLGMPAVRGSEHDADQDLDVR